ncbi:hypothetical protein, partial [Salmonella enterica]|uniref:hypothetical protein n=1 Tax=Salmonella enterica TaxID=28901 RepID=UPI003529A2B5
VAHRAHPQAGEQQHGHGVHASGGGRRPGRCAGRVVPGKAERKRGRQEHGRQCGKTGLRQH